MQPIKATIQMLQTLKKKSSVTTMSVLKYHVNFLHHKIEGGNN